MSSAFSSDSSSADAERPHLSSIPTPPGWTTISTFEIIINQQTQSDPSRYQTWVRHLPTEMTEVFTGVFSDRLLAWMQGRVAATAQSHAETSAHRGQPLLEIKQVVFLQVNNPASPITIAGPYESIPPALKRDEAFTLEITWEVTPWGTQQLIQYPEEFTTCQIQAFVKPLSPIQSSDHWRQATSLPIHSADTRYLTRLNAITLGAGIYSLQILCLMSHLRSSPVLVEIPAFQVN